MGSGGVAIAALPTVICLKVSFSDGLGGYHTGLRLPPFKGGLGRVLYRVTVIMAFPYFKKEDGNCFRK